MFKPINFLFLKFINYYIFIIINQFLHYLFLILFLINYFILINIIMM